MPRRSLFCVSAPTGLVHWYQPRLGGAHLRPHVRTRHSTERGQSIGKKRAVGDVWGHGSRKMKIRPLRAWHRSRDVCSTFESVCAGRSLQCGRRSGRAQGGRERPKQEEGCKPADHGRISRWSTPFFWGFRVCYLGRNHPSSHLPGEDRLRHISADGRFIIQLLMSKRSRKAVRVIKG